MCTKSQKDCIADSALECKTDIYDQIFDTALRIRKEVNHGNLRVLLMIAKDQTCCIAC